MFCILAKDFKKHQPTATTTTIPNNNISTMAKDQQEDSSCQTEEGNRNSSKKMKQTNKKVNNCTWWDLLICITSINKASWLLRNLKRRKAVFVLQKSLEFEGRQNNNDSCCCMRSGNIIMFLICPSSLLSLLTIPICCCMFNVESTNDDLLVLCCDGFFCLLTEKAGAVFTGLVFLSVWRFAEISKSTCLAQLAEHQSCNLEVVSSNLSARIWDFWKSSNIFGETLCASGGWDP